MGEKFKKGIEEHCTISVIHSGHQVLHEKHAAGNITGFAALISLVSFAPLHDPALDNHTIIYSLQHSYHLLLVKLAISSRIYSSSECTHKQEYPLSFLQEMKKKISAYLLAALQQQTYPKELFEVIVIDDHSEDRTAEIVKQFNDVKLLSLQNESINSYKKKAIETGIAAATGELIVTTDADCIPPEELATNNCRIQRRKTSSLYCCAGCY